MSESSPNEFTRRKFLTTTGLGLVAATAAGEMLQPASAQQPMLEQLMSATQPLPGQQPIPLPGFLAKTEIESETAPMQLPPDKRLGYAIVGLGRLSLEEILPAFSECKRSKPVALVSGDPNKAAQVASQYGINPKNIYNYQNYDNLHNNQEVDIIYIVLPNNMHLEYTVRGAKAGKHILCEKPMANSVKDCQQMIDACKQTNRLLMIAYRCQYEPYNRSMIRMARNKELGVVKAIIANNGQNMGNPKQWRLNKAMAGGGSLPDVGIYCLNAARYITGEEPIEVFANAYSTPGDPRFREVEENLIFQLQFPSGVLANCTTGYGYHTSRRYRVNAADGWFEMDPAFSYKGLRMRITRAKEMSECVEERRMEEKNQFALEMDHMSQCVMENKRPHTPGEEGLQDIRLIEALYESARTGSPVKLPAVAGLDAFRGPEPTS